MAVIQYSAIVSQIRGKLAGSVFSKFETGFSLYRKANPRQFGSQLQQKTRNYFQAFSGRWRQLTTFQRENWRFVASETPFYSRLGELRPINGYAYFVKFNQLLAGFYPVPMDNVTTDLEPAYPVTVEADPAVFSLTEIGFVLDSLDITLTTLGDSVYQNLALVYFSQPIPYQDFKYYGTWYKCAGVLVDPNLGTDEEIQINLSNVIMPAGFRSFAGALHLMKVVMVSIDSAQFSAQSLTDIVLEPEPDIEFPIMEAPDPTGENALAWFGSTDVSWVLYFNKVGGDGDPLDFEIMLSCQYGSASEPDPSSLSYLTMGTFDLVDPVPNGNFVPGSPGPIYDIGPQVVSAFSGNVPMPGGGEVLWLRYRLRHKATSQLGDYDYQAFGVYVG